MSHLVGSSGPVAGLLASHFVGSSGNAADLLTGRFRYSEKLTMLLPSVSLHSGSVQLHIMKIINTENKDWPCQLTMRLPSSCLHLHVLRRAAHARLKWRRSSEWQESSDRHSGA
ncbi:hypothetical protein AMECASPLE_024597 [Ameca splendens]|uniref:Uncharacterized protein n=1 Tax=Ameca splendens TaxID=208324 RepID=A0ABV0Z395_9TELE